MVLDQYHVSRSNRPEKWKQDREASHNHSLSLATTLNTYSRASSSEQNRKFGLIEVIKKRDPGAKSLHMIGTKYEKKTRDLIN